MRKWFLWKWVWYCSVCDWMFFKNRTVIVVGWWNSAFTEALYLSDICEKVILVHRNENIKAENVLVDKVKSRKNI